MKGYLIPALDDAQRRRFTEAGVEFYEWDATSIIIEQPHLSAALSVLGATATEKETEYENILKLVLRFNASETAADGRKPVEPSRGDGASSQAKHAYVKACEARRQAQFAEALAAHEAQRQELPPLEERFVQLTRHKHFASSALSESDHRENFLAELESVRQLPAVLDVRIIDGAILVYTDKLLTTNPATGRKHEIGSFLIHIRLDGREHGVRWFNSTRRVDAVREGMNAPNVYADGTPGASEMKETFLELIARCELSVLVELAMQFIETAENDEFSKFIDRWPLAQVQEEIRDEERQA